MVLCDKDCIPCCDYCKYVFHHWGEVNGKIVLLAPIGCGLHEDAEHQDFAKGCYYCEDFHCVHADEDVKDIYMERLEEYKSTGLTPREIEQMKARMPLHQWAGESPDKMSIFGVSVSKIIELTDAYKQKEKKQKYLHDPEIVKLFEDLERVERKKYKLQRDMYPLACEMCDEEEYEDDST